MSSLRKPKTLVQLLAEFQHQSGKVNCDKWKLAQIYATRITRLFKQKEAES